ncbi:DNA polymerase III subunit epsilon [Entomobacter blattae]|uniref:DNA polymerase III subunit epsilon n=1 Tax=Entomobacter blattae TaxID=2762277 RepID=A0A7H1NSB1_9PROT|nr:DNA polymerase III subunit epsilon [Entomobacter blattae]QNT78671.1 DNA polymerase III subunit epsilon [Entomobacter blattae]
MARTVLFDTETTGLSPESGDRVIEIAVIELINDLPTDKYFYALIDPERDVPEEASKVHGYKTEDVKGKPVFAEIVDDFLDFVGNDPLVAHNARFDFGFMNAELVRVGRKGLDMDRMVDTLELARKKFPGMPNSLDALCRRFSIDISERTTHNALLDCRLLAQVYVELMGGRQHGLALLQEELKGAELQQGHKVAVRTKAPVLVKATPEELERHAAFIKALPHAMWLKE